jgi:hypothetical protein
MASNIMVALLQKKKKKKNMRPEKNLNVTLKDNDEEEKIPDVIEISRCRWLLAVSCYR